MRIQVLLSTYNGCEHVVDQVQSLFQQKLPTGAQLQILARDDGSSDGTLEVLDELAKKDSRLRVYSGRNVGVIASFFDLLYKADPEAQYFFFCDQDDIWLPSKVARAIASLETKKDLPALYFSRLQYVNNDLRPIGQSRIPHRISFASALVENVATGCSMAFNQALRQVALSGEPLPAMNCLMHDWWMYILANAVGEVLYDPTPSVWYRQHQGNVVGASSNIIAIYKTKWRRFWQRGARAPRVSDQAQSFLNTYAKLISPACKIILYRLIHSKKSFWRRLLYALTLPTRRQSPLDNLIFRLLILLNRY
jgi:glycosyltransferase involved in cell wall biosynthesis